MTDIAMNSSHVSETVADRVPVQSTVVKSDTLPLITEQQVMFATAAVALPRSKTRGAWDAVTSFAHSVHVSLTPKPRPARQSVAKRYSYLEDALMAREMDRL